MEKRTATVEKAVEVLNRAFAADPVAMEMLFNIRSFTCSEVLAGDPTIQVANEPEVEGEPMWSFGLIGIINGIFGADEEHWGAITAQFELRCYCGADVPEGSVEGDLCAACGEKITCTKLLGFADNGRNVGHTE